MTGTQNIPHSLDVTQRKDSTVFGVPIGRLGLLSRLLICGACALMAFLITFFFAIIGVAIYDSVHNISIANLNIAYRDIAAPVGVVAMLASLIFLVGGWARSKFSAGSHSRLSADE